MTFLELNSYFGLPKSEKAKRFFDIFSEIERIEGTFWGIVDLANPFHHIYFSQSIEPCLGYPLSSYYGSQRFEFMSSITPKEDWPMISSKQAYYAKEALEPGFDYTAPQFMDFGSSFIASDSRNVPIVYKAVVLDYVADGTMKTLIGVYWDASAKKHALIEFELNQVANLFAELKKIYVELAPKKFLAIKASQTPLTQLYFPADRPAKNLTPRELTILKLLGQGLTAKEISNRERISFNTVETHRKHLLEKFNASNVAELINKASKVYWLE